MSYRNSDSDGILAVVRGHDAARTIQHNSTKRIRAHARMEQIMAEPISPDLRFSASPRTEVSATSPRFLRGGGWLGNPTVNPTSTKALAKPKLSRSQLALRLIAIPVAAAALIAGSALLPQGPAGPQPAFASWTALPAAVSPDLLGPASAACLAGLQESLATDRGGPQLLTPVDGQPFAAEQRGNWIMLSYAPDETRFENCIAQIVNGEPRFERGTLQGAGMIGVARNRFVMDDPSGFNPGFTIGRGTTSPPAPDGFGSFTYSEDVLPGEGQMSTFFGDVGADVVGAVIHLPNGEEVVATVTGGMVMAWWPTPVEIAADLDEVNSWRSGSDFRPIDHYISAITVTLLDGTTREINLNN